MSSAADRNLLFGILALQSNFISREQLIAAMHAWVLEKQTTIDEILVRQGALHIEHRALLEPLIAAQIKQHGNDPQKCLAAVSSIESVRDDLKQLADPEIERSLVHVSQDRRATGDQSDPHATRSVGESTSDGLRFRILRPHAKGGLGEVFVAEDGELHREVALKQIQSRHADDSNSRSRFMLEAEITGGLEHPGIVPVYGLGTYADGRPFYAMRFIRGDSLKGAIERFHSTATAKPSPGERTLQFRKLLGRFIDVCNAIDYAHSRGVLHRDLKPGNIMLGKYGETLVVDWGLAKAIGRPDDDTDTDGDERSLHPASGSGSAPTQMGSAIGTPQFMSPEQAEGRLDLLGPQSDVYSLGATLYCLLCGQPPLAEHADVGEVLRLVQRGEISPPSGINPEVAKPLEAVCLKAMALKPADRYVSPRRLVDDIEHWLADEPISAAPDTSVERAGRWLRRHRTLARSLAAVLATIAIGSTASAILINQQRERADAQKALAQQSAAKEKQLAEEKSALANDNAALAIKEGEQRRKAEQLARDNGEIAEQEKTARKQAEQLATEKADLATKEQTARKNAEQLAKDKAGLVEGERTARQSAEQLARDKTELAGRESNARQRADEAAQKLRRQLTIATAWRMNSDSVRLAGQSPELSILLSLAAIDRFRGLKEQVPLGVEDGLRTALSATPGISLRDAPGAQLDGTTARFSPGGKWAAVYMTGDIQAPAAAPAPADKATPPPPPPAGTRSAAYRLNRVDAEGTARLCVWDVGRGAQAAELKLTAHPVSHVPVFNGPPPPPPKGARLDRRVIQPIGVRRMNFGLFGPVTYQNDFEFTPDDRWLITFGADQETLLWNLATEKVPEPLKLAGGHDATCVACSRDSRWLAVGTSAVALAQAKPFGAPLLGPPAPAPTPSAPSRETPPPPPPRGKSTRSEHLPLPLGEGRGEGANTQTVAEQFDHRSTLHLLPAVLRLNEPADQSPAAILVYDLNRPDPSAAPIFLLRQSDLPISRIEFSPDGRFLATEDGDATLHLWDVSRIQTGAAPELLVVKHDSECTSLVFSRDSHWCAEGYADGVANVWDLSQPRLQLAPAKTFHAAAGFQAKLLGFGGNSNWLVGNNVEPGDFLAGSEIRLWNLSSRDTNNSKVIDKKHSFADGNVELSPSGRWLATAKLSDGSVNSLLLWDLGSAEPRDVSDLAETRRQTWFNVACSGDESHFAAYRFDGAVVVWNLGDRQSAPIHVPGIQGGGLSDPTSLDLKLNRDATELIVGDHYRGAGPGLTRVCDVVEARSSIEPFQVAALRPTLSFACAMSPDGRWLACGDDRDGVRLWRASTHGFGNGWTSISGLGSPPVSLAFSRGGNLLAAGCEDGSIHACQELTDGTWRKVKSMRGGCFAGTPELQHAMTDLAFSPDGRRLLAWYAPDLTPEQRLGILTDTIDENPLHAVGLWNLDPNDNYPWPRQIFSHDKVVRFNFSADGRWLATAGAEGVRLWDLSEPEPAKKSRLFPMGKGSAKDIDRFSGGGYEPAPTTIRFGGNDRWLIGGNYSLLRAWDLNSAAPTQNPKEFHVSGLHSDLSDDGRWLVICNTGGATGAPQLGPPASAPAAPAPAAPAPASPTPPPPPASTQNSPSTLRVKSVANGQVPAAADAAASMTVLLFDLRAPGGLEAPRYFVGPAPPRQPTNPSNEQLSISHDGLRLALTGGDGVTKIYDLRKNQPLAEPEFITWPAGRADAIDFLPNGRLAAIAAGRGLTIAVADFDELIELAERVAGRELAGTELAPYGLSDTSAGPEPTPPVAEPLKAMPPPPPPGK